MRAGSARPRRCARRGKSPRPGRGSPSWRRRAVVDHSEAYFKIGDFAQAEAVNSAAFAAAEEAGDARSAIAARLGSTLIGLLVRGEGGVDEVADEINRALPTFEAAGDDSTVARLLIRLADVYWWRCQVGPMEETLERASTRPPRRRPPPRVGGLGPARLRDPVRPAGDRPRPSSAGRVGRGRRAGECGQGVLARLVEPAGRDGRRIRRCAHALSRREGDPRRPGPWCRRCCDHDVDERDRALGRRSRRGRTGARGPRSSSSRRSASARTWLRSPHSSRRPCTLQGRSEEALAVTFTSEEASSPDDVHAQISWRVARAKALAQLGRGREAEEIASAAVELAGTTDSPVFAAEALLAVAEAHAAAGEVEEGRDAAGRAQQLFEAKGNVIAAGRARALSEELAARTALTRG